MRFQAALGVVKRLDFSHFLINVTRRREEMVNTGFLRTFIDKSNRNRHFCFNSNAVEARFPIWLSAACPFRRN